MDDFNDIVSDVLISCKINLENKILNKPGPPCGTLLYKTVFI